MLSKGCVNLIWVYSPCNNFMNVMWYLIVAEPPLSPTSGRVEGEVKLSISYRNSTLFIMVMHIRDLVKLFHTYPDRVTCCFIISLCVYLLSY